MLIKPERLRRGDEIGIIAPAGPVVEEDLRSGLDLLRSAGHSIIPGPNLFRRQEYLAGSDDARLSDLHAMFSNEKVKAVFCARGGYGTLRLLNKINYDLIQQNPKIFVGYSDITALLLAIHQKTGLATIHGPVVKDLFKNEGRNLHSLFRLLCSEETTKLHITGGRALREGKASGTLLGGNLSILCHLAGTPFMPGLRGAILFIEEKKESLYRVDRMLTHLKLTGLLDGLVGLIAGQFEDCGPAASIDRLLLETMGDVGIPVIGGLPAGHGEENVALPIGLQVTLDSKQMTLATEESGVRL